MKPIIKLDNISVGYSLGKSNETWVLKNITGEIYPEEYVIFFGHSGCGKSTLLYTIAGLEFPTKGCVDVSGRNLCELPIEEHIKFHRSIVGMIFQAYYLLPGLTVQDNILLPQIFSETPHIERTKRVRDLMRRFGISQLKDKKVALLSGGQQQRVAIARALINDPPIILADEPVGNLDSKNAEIVLDLLAELNKKDKKTIIHVTHDARSISRADRIFHMKDGTIERVVRNSKKASLSDVSKKEISDLEKLAQAYPYLTESRLKSKLILHHLLFTIGIEEQQMIEQAIDKYILGQVAGEGLCDLLDRPFEEGGANLYKQKAKKLSNEIIKLADEIGVTISGQKHPDVNVPRERAIELLGYLLDRHKGVLSFEQVKRMEEFLLQRIVDKIDKEQFFQAIDVSFNQGGVGLNKRTAKKFARVVDLILTNHS